MSEDVLLLLSSIILTIAVAPLFLLVAFVIVKIFEKWDKEDKEE